MQVFPYHDLSPYVVCVASPDLLGRCRVGPLGDGPARYYASRD